MFFSFPISFHFFSMLYRFEIREKEICFGNSSLMFSATSCIFHFYKRVTYDHHVWQRMSRASKVSECISQLFSCSMEKSHYFFSRFLVCWWRTGVMVESWIRIEGKSPQIWSNKIFSFNKKSCNSTAKLFNFN